VWTIRGREDVVGSGFRPDAEVDFDPSTLGCALRPEYTFARFVVGDSNRNAYQVARHVARMAPGATTNGSLYLHGGVGVGKTHLATAIGHAVRAEHGAGAVLAVPAERLAAWWRGEGHERRALEVALRDARLLIVDDVQFLADDEHSRAALLREVARSRAGGRQVVLTCDLPPHATPDLALPLTDGAAAVRAAEIAPPDPALRREILVDKASRLGSELAADVAAFIAGVAPASVRALEGALHRVLEFAVALRVPLSVPVAARALDAWRKKAPPPSLDVIAGAVADAFGVPRRRLRQAGWRDRETVAARQVAIYLARRFAERTLHEIAADYGCRDHSVAAHACARVKSRLAAEPSFADRVRRLERMLGGAVAAPSRQEQASGAG
jgi:chromosomal replication initiator protein